MNIVKFSRFTLLIRREVLQNTVRDHHFTASEHALYHELSATSDHSSVNIELRVSFICMRRGENFYALFQKVFFPPTPLGM